MKNKNLIIIVFILFNLVNLNAQVKSNLIKTSLVFPLGEIFEISYERVFNDDMGAQLSLFFGGEMELGVMPEFRYYLSETRLAPNGAYVAPFLLTSIDISGGGIMVGYQRLFKEKISLEASLGPFITTEGVTGMGGINIGFAF
jgi:hypothetical protein